MSTALVANQQPQHHHNHTNSPKTQEPIPVPKLPEPVHATHGVPARADGAGQTTDGAAAEESEGGNQCEYGADGEKVDGTGGVLQILLILD
jgi:hypothetical protein